jgi:hypothetical protein
MASEITLETLRDEIGALRIELRGDLIRLEAKIDGKPSLMAMFSAVLIVVFGMFCVVGTTVGVLASLHLFG